MKKTKQLFLIWLCAAFFFQSVLSLPSQAKPSFNILMVIGSGFGESYFVNKALMEDYGWTITTTSTSTNVLSCQNKPDLENVESDILIQDIDDKELKKYDCVVVPSGGHWLTLSNTPTYTDFISSAYNDSGILTAGICTGVIVLGHAGILQDVHIAYSAQLSSYLSGSGCIMDHLPVVNDQGIITGGSGGGTGNGPEGAPNEAFCEEIKIELESRNSSNLAWILVPSITAGVSIIGIGAFLFRKKKWIK